MKSIVMLLSFFAILMIAIGYINQLKKCPPSRVEYRYIPRTFQEEQDNPVKVSELYEQMFNEPSPWISGFKFSSNETKNREINRYFISQT